MTETITYNDRVVRQFIGASVIWGLIGMLAGLYIAGELAWWQLNGGIEYITFGRLRPIHTNGVIFAFAANAIFAGTYHSMQRLLKVRLPSDKLASLHFWGWQLIVVLDVLYLATGHSQGKEYAEPGWILDILITLIWVVFAVNVFWMIAIRRIKHIYVAIWFYIATIVTIAVLHIVNNLAMPAGLLHSFSIYPGVQDAMVQWWYGHNAVGFLLTTPFLGLMYYYLPKAAGRPVFSYRLSILHFWALVFLYIWAGPHHLHYTALPDWAQSLGMVFSVMLWAPSWGGMINGLYTLRGAFDKLRKDPVLKFMVVAVTFYGMSTFEGPMMSIKSVNSLSHYTDWTIGHVHSGALGWVAFLIFGMFYYLVPRLWNTKLYSTRAAEVHFWIGTLGIIIYVISMWIAGVTQGLMWRAFTPDGLLRYPNFMETVIKILPMYYIRFFGGLLFLSGVILMIWNLLKTIGQSEGPAVEGITVAENEGAHSEAGHGWIEARPFVFTSVALVVILVGTLFELVPILKAEFELPKLAKVEPYTPLELHGRTLYIGEGCYVCHSQMVRPFRHETERYGEYSKAGEFVYDHPFQWGSRRIGPDLHRVGGKYPDLWHYRHLVDPRSTSPGSIMPPYSFLTKKPIDYDVLASSVAAMKALGVPYSDDEVRDAVSLAKQQAAKIEQGLEAAGAGDVPSDSEILALIAYLQRLGTDINWRQNP
ncbi:MAG: cytochrome-c oxidase, cbb3-type subunit I [Candidatus Dadabacteria bacterium]|nr:MAG: cytochrome-c oxidase, cbb3-type subunit I [Candidatus Dadabacteria bacterium]